MVTFGLIGHPLGHSFSAKYFGDKFKESGLNDHQYLLFDRDSLTDIRKLESEYPGLKGLNVTIPYKKKIIQHIDSLDSIAAEIGAVNCIAVDHSGWRGYNTDAPAFKSSLEEWLISLNHVPIQKALIFGSGGSSLAVQWACRQMGIEYNVVSRQHNPDYLDYSDLSKTLLESHELLINTTPVGMVPSVHEMVKVPVGYLRAEHLLYDLIYNPANTLFLEAGVKMGSKVKNGLDMLHKQAEISWHIWNQNKEHNT